jgi:hypothetical protein
MTIHLPEDLQRYVQDQVLAGRFRSEDDVIEDALNRHRQAQHAPGTPGPSEEATNQQLQRLLLEAGIISEIKPPITDFTPYENRQTISVQGEPLSETVIRERR